jgi:predicted DNA-binding WGR domain protein
MLYARDTTALPSHIHMQAIDPARNIARDYRIEVSPDLFGHIIVELHWGRIGTRGQRRWLSFESEAEAKRYVRGTLTRRVSAKRRIGVPYRVVH